MNRKRLLRKLSQGALQNVKFAEACDLVEAFGFRLARTRGSHHVFTCTGVPELINLQDVRGEAKPYQLRQFLRLVERYNLTLEEEA